MNLASTGQALVSRGSITKLPRVLHVELESSSLAPQHACCPQGLPSAGLCLHVSSSISLLSVWESPEEHAYDYGEFPVWGFCGLL